MGRHRPKDREHKGSSEARWKSDERAVRIHFKDKSKYHGNVIRLARHNNGVGRPPLNDLEIEFRKNNAARGQQNDMEL